MDGTVRISFFFNDTATTEIYTLSLHDALPISRRRSASSTRPAHGLHPSLTRLNRRRSTHRSSSRRDRKSTRLNSSHQIISYAVFCLKKKKEEVSEVLDSVEGILGLRSCRKSHT